MSVALPDDVRIIRPFPDSPQEDFVASPVKEAALGGGRGRGGTFGLALSQLRHTPHPKFRGLLLRRTVPELADLIDKCSEIYRADNRVKFNMTEKRFYFPSGASIWLAAMERHDDWRKFQGHGLGEIGFDELGNWELEKTYLIMWGSLRVPGNFMPTYIRATFNPGGPGAQWVKRRFVDPAPPGTIIYDGRTKPERRTPELSGRIYYHGTFRDNPELNNDDYESTLDSLPENIRKQMKDGQYDVFEGQEFTEWDPARHIIKPHPIPHGAKMFHALDYGYSSASCYLALYEDEDRNLVVFDELYVTRVTADRMAEMVRDRERKYGRDLDGPLDRQCFAQTGHIGPTIAEAFWRKGVRFIRSMKDRFNGMSEVHSRLSTFSENYRDGVKVVTPAIRIFDSCRHLIETIPRMQQDGTGQDVKEGGDDHCVVGGTLVDTTLGPVAIERLVGAHGKVYSIDGTAQAFWNARLTQRDVPTVIVSMQDDREVQCTPNHRFATDRGWVDAQFLSPGDCIVSIYAEDATSPWAASTSISHPPRRQFGLEIIEPMPDLSISKTAHAAIVSSVNAAEWSDVYCLTVPATGCFSVSGGLIIANCYDALCYALMYRPMSARPSKARIDIDKDEARLDSGGDRYADPITGYGVY